MPVRHERLAWAEAKARECRRIALRYFGRRLTIERKADQSPVTIADRAIEEFLRKQLARAFPGEAIVGEEFGAPTDPGRSYWTIDPIDGTRAFSLGLPSWGILLGWIQDGQASVGACDYPAIKTFIGAAPGVAYERVGTQRRALPKARPATTLRDAAIFHGGLRWWVGHPLEPGLRRLSEACYLERAYGDCYGYLWVFRGHVDAMLEVGVKIWDVAPLAPLARATGRVMLDLSGRPNFVGPDTLVATQSLARQIIETLHG
jgi:fructose-1,6-bisphosphatase/inositol monophosphatase family enzyme